MLTQEELTSGDRLYFLDFVAPYGHAKQVARHLRTDVFPNETGTSVRFTENAKAPMKILKFHGIHHKKRLN